MGRDCERHGEDGLVTAPNPSRRAFLRRAGSIAGAAALAGSAAGALFPKKAEANVYVDEYINHLSKEIPPGIKHARDQAIPYADWAWMRGNLEIGGIAGKEEAYCVLRLSNARVVNERIKKDTPYHEPAFWFMVSLVQGENSAHYSDLKKRNTALYYFSHGISNYFGRWVNYNGYYQKAAINEWVEKNFLKSLYAASEIKNPPSMNEYWDYDLHNKKILFQRIMIELKHKDYDRQIVAEWSSTWLANHYGSVAVSDSENKEADYLFNFVNKCVEVPLRKYVPRVRARENGPHYFNKQI